MHEELGPFRREVQARLEQMKSRWRPVALQLAQQLPEAQQVAREAGVLGELRRNALHGNRTVPGPLAHDRHPESGFLEEVLENPQRAGLAGLRRTRELPADLERYAAVVAGQLDAYTEALNALKRPVIAQVVHFPTVGLAVEL